MSRATISPLPACPFIAGPRIEDARLFVGRKAELKYIADHMSGAQPISVNIVGERRIGKSSLLYHYFQTWEQRITQSGNYVVAFLSLQDAKCRNRKEFFSSLAGALLERGVVHNQLELAAPLQSMSPDGQSFTVAMQIWKQHGVLPVICLDEFEALLKNPQEFDDNFYDGLRSLMDNNALMLVVSSLHPLDTYQNTPNWFTRFRRAPYPLTSSFFNLGHTKILQRLPEEEITDLLCLPASTVPGMSAALSMEEQRLAKKWADGHPYLLQLAATYLCQARQTGRDANWAEGQFRLDARRLPRRNRNRIRPLHWLLWDVPQALGRLIKRTGSAADELKNWLLGMGLILIIVLAGIGILTQTQILDLLSQFLGMGQ